MRKQSIYGAKYFRTKRGYSESNGSKRPAYSLENGFGGKMRDRGLFSLSMKKNKSFKDSSKKTTKRCVPP